MANGDIAAAAGLPVVSPMADIKQGYDEINITRDEIATHMTTGTHTWVQVTGKPTTYPASNLAEGASPNTVVKRNAQATFAVSTPTAADHVATKGYVDAQIAALAARVAALEGN